MNKKFIWIINIANFLVQFNVNAANNLDIEFSGELVSTVCQVSTESVNRKITLYNLRWQYINENVNSAVTPFSIVIENCSEADLQKKIKMTWQSNKLININENYFFTTKGDSGVVLGIVDKDDNPITWNNPISIGSVSINNGYQQFDYGVFARKPVIGDAKVGDFSGTVTFSVEYE